MTQENITTLTRQALYEQFGENYNPELSLKDNEADRVDIGDIEDLIEHLFCMAEDRMKGALSSDMSFDYIIKVVEMKLK